jgi:two-component system CheB/CheR fusion protein
VWGHREGALVEGVAVHRGEGELLSLDVRITPLVAGDTVLGATVVYSDVSARHRLETELGTSRRELEGAYEELQSTVEELETTNEELQSTNEELETTNEELQSTNEELETMNEELQSTNEELETINDELRQRTLELNGVNSFLETILSSLHVAVAVVDSRQHVVAWNERAEDLWGLRAAEAEGEHFLKLDIGLPVEHLRGSLRARLDGTNTAATQIFDAKDRRGRDFRCEVTLMPAKSADGDGDGDGSSVVVLMKRLEDAAA